MTNLLQRILPTVQKPARYTGGEYNQVVKPLEQVDVRIAFCFPDTYELGMSNGPCRILYGVMNRNGRGLVPAGLCPLGRHGSRHGSPPPPSLGSGEPGPSPGL